MTTYRVLALTTILLGAAVACEKASEPPPETPPGPSAVPVTPDPVATTPVATTEPSAAPTQEAPAEPAPSAVPTKAASASSPLPATETAHHATATTKAAPVAESAPAPAPAVEDPCQTKNFHFSQIAGACHNGGRKAAKGVMKGVVQKAKAAGTSLQCTSCHEDTHDFHLKSNAVSDLKNWL